MPPCGTVALGCLAVALSDHFTAEGETFAGPTSGKTREWNRSEEEPLLFEPKEDTPEELDTLTVGEASAIPGMSANVRAARFPFAGRFFLAALSASRKRV